MAFDPEKSQRHDYVRVKIRFDVSKPLRTINLFGGEQTTILYYYEKVQKRCYHCQRLTHAKERCPFINTCKGKVISEKDPLFGVLNEDQVGINPLSGRPRISPEVLEEMQNYLLASSNEDRLVREQRVISSVKEAKQNPITQKSVLQLIPPPAFTKDLKGRALSLTLIKMI